MKIFELINRSIYIHVDPEWFTSYEEFCTLRISIDFFIVYGLKDSRGAEPVEQAGRQDQDCSIQQVNRRIYG